MGAAAAAAAAVAMNVTIQVGEFTAQGDFIVQYLGAPLFAQLDIIAHLDLCASCRVHLAQEVGKWDERTLALKVVPQDSNAIILISS